MFLYSNNRLFISSPCVIRPINTTQTHLFGFVGSLCYPFCVSWSLVSFDSSCTIRVCWGSVNMAVIFIKKSASNGQLVCLCLLPFVCMVRIGL